MNNGLKCRKPVCGFPAFVLSNGSGLAISKILASGELDETSVGFSDRSTGGRKPKIYNLDMILSVGYRVYSKRGIAFRKWANNVLKQFVLKGCF